VQNLDPSVYCFKHMKNTPRYIVFWTVSNYLSGSQLEILIADFIKKSPKQDRKFLSIIRKHFDFERLRTSPIFWQDIWIYNYLMFDVKSKIKPNKLLFDYERTIMKTTMKTVHELKDILNQV